MKERDINEKLLKHAIDHPGQSLPPDLAEIIQKNDNANQEWKRIQGWMNLLKDDQPWQAPEGFYQKLADRAFYEKRRADLTASTTRDLHLEDDEQVWRPFISPWLVRSVLIGLFLLVIGLPLFMMLVNEWYTIGQFDYVEGNILTKADGNVDVDYQDPIHRDASIVTPANSSCIVKLEGGASLVIAALSRVNIDDSRNVIIKQGRVFFDITPGQGDFNIQVPDGSVHVIGTEFEIQVEMEKTSVLVTEGTVLLNDGTVEEPLTAGHLGEFLPAQPLSIKPAPNAQQRINWVRSLKDKKNKSDIQRYYPSLARPTETSGE